MCWMKQNDKKELQIISYFDILNKDYNYIIIIITL